MSLVERDDVAIERGGADDVPALRELWLELHHHHQEVAPRSGTRSSCSPARVGVLSATPWSA